MQVEVGARTYVVVGFGPMWVTPRTVEFEDVETRERRTIVIPPA
jgi:hypothetical protein